MNFLITGGAGFIGSAVIRHLIQHTSHRVLNIDKLTYAGNLASLKEVEDHKNYRFLQADICDRQAIKQAFTDFKPDVVMHLAAESHVDRSIDGPGTFIDTNINGTYTLLEEARAYYVNLTEEKKQDFRFHHISTDEVFGDLPHPDEYDENATTSLPLFTEEHPYQPSSPYSASKAASDHLVRAWYRTYGLPVVLTNCSNNYGPYHFPEKLIPLMILNALHGKPLPVYGKGDQIRDWLYVEDHARALVLVAEQGKVGQTYCIGGHNEKKNIEVVQTLCAILNELVPVSENKHLKAEIADYTDLISYVKDRPGHDRRYAIDASKIERELGWKPQESFESGLRKTVQWYLDNPNWWQAILDGTYQLQRLGEGN